MGKPPGTVGVLLEAAAALRDELDALSFGPPVEYVYDPLAYAFDGYRRYIEKFARGEKAIVFVGMNPGPFGMAQTGVPFGEVGIVSTWMKITADEVHVGHPPREHPSRPVMGFACHRSEVSGARLWGAIRARHPNPSTFFERALVLNYCPLLFLEASGRNLTPDKLPRAERAHLESACDAHLLRCLDVLAPQLVVGVGGWTEKRARGVVGRRVKVGCLPHPSPASPQANRGWDQLARQALAELGVDGLL